MLYLICIMFFSLLQFLVYFVFIDFFQCIKEQQ